MKTITPLEMNELLAAEPGLALLDVRTPLEHAEVNVAQARNEPLVGLRPKMLFDSGRLSKDRPVYLICRTGGRAAKAAERFAAEGFDQGVVIEGGTQAWIAAGLPVERGEVKVISLERQVRIAAGALVLAGVVLAYFLHPAFIGFRPLWVQDWSLPALPIGAAWHFCLPSSPGTSAGPPNGGVVAQRFASVAIHRK